MGRATQGAKRQIIVSEKQSLVSALRAKAQPLMPNAITAATTQNKIQKCLLNSNHPVGKNKARVLNSMLGYHYENWDILSNKIIDAVQIMPFSKMKGTKYGTRYEIPVRTMGEKRQKYRA